MCGHFLTLLSISCRPKDEMSLQVRDIPELSSEANNLVLTGIIGESKGKVDEGESQTPHFLFLFTLPVLSFLLSIHRNLASLCERKKEGMIKRKK